MDNRRNQQGFSQIELLVVVGIVAAFIGLSLFADINGFRGDAFRAEVSSLGRALQTARADALNNINEKRHGVAIRPAGYDGYVIFEGTSYAARNSSRDERIKASYDVTIAPGSPAEIVFDQLSGNTNYDGNITIIDPNRAMSAVLSINHEGRISW